MPTPASSRPRTGIALRIGARALLVALAVLVGAGCQPVDSYDWIARSPRTGEGLVRNTCTIPWKVNLAGLPRGFDPRPVLRREMAVLTRLTGVPWVELGTTTARRESGLPTRFVLIEFRPVVDGNGMRRAGWSQPEPARGPYYTGGSMWIDPVAIEESTFARLVAHELGHQYGLADLYDPIGPVDRSQRMGSTSFRSWQRGDLKGLAVASRIMRSPGCVRL